jgi:putative endonuclease
MFYLYILQSRKDLDYYIGSTKDLKKRFELHNAGRIYSTKLRRPFELVYYEAYKDEGIARHRESNLKLRSRAFAQLRKRLELQNKVGVGVND